jgi:hypothetical protein
MWAILFNKKVIGCSFNLEDKNLKEYTGCEFIEMTEKNSPATVGNYYNGLKFIDRTELI